MPDINSPPNVIITLDVARHQIQLKNVQNIVINQINDIKKFIFLDNPIAQQYPISTSYSGSMKIEAKYETWYELSNHQKEKGCFSVVHVTTSRLPSDLTLCRLTFTSFPFLPFLKSMSTCEKSLLTADVTFTAEEIRWGEQSHTR